jgi:diguanylate cyclase (GGDEF)-like protein
LRKAVILLLALLCALLMPPHGAMAAAPAAAAGVDFAMPAESIDLESALSPYHAPGGDVAPGSRWYIVSVLNTSTHPVTRVLIVEEPADASLRVFPYSTRAMLMQVASSDAGVVVTHEQAFRRDAFRVTLPPATKAALALRVSNAEDPPSLLAWSEVSLVAYYRQLAIFIAAVAGLIAAAAAITAGVAAMTGHAAPRRAAVTLVGVLAIWLANIGLLDRIWINSLGGPYGLIGLVEGLTLAAALMLADSVAPFSDLWAGATRHKRWALIVLGTLGVLALAGVPAASLAVQALVILGVAGLAAYLVRRGAGGSRAARILAPGAAVFALVALAATVVAFGGMHDNPVAGRIVGGFAAAGAVLLALSIAAGEGLGLMGPRLATAATAPLPIGPVPAPEPPAAPRATETDRAPDKGTAAALAAIGASHQGVYELDFRTETLKLSPDAAVLIGLPDRAQSMAHAAWTARVHQDDRTIYRDALRDYRSHPGLAFRIEFRVRSESGRFPWFELRATMIGEGEQAERCLGLMADVTTRKEAEAAAYDHTMRDALTGLGNRVALMDDLERLERRASDHVFAVLDIDRFKSIHASLGDAGADAILRHVAERLVKRFASAGHAYRIGGDSFALLFANAADKANAIGAEILELCAAPLIENGRKVFAPVSVGLATGREAGEPLDLLRNGELALRQAKREGGGCARLYSRELAGSAPRDSVALEAELRRALDEGQLDVFYQPVMRLSDRTVAGFEALLRWHHPERGLVWPSDFVGHSEETGLIVSLGKFALARSAQDLARWQHHFPVTPPLYVSVNISRRQLQDDTFEGFLGDILKNSGVAGGSLRLEVTESAIAANDHAPERLARIRAKGAGLAIDDFGTGLSSLSQLKSIPFDIVKIDKSFLSRQEGAEADADAILHSIIALAREMNRALVVEGVESEEDATRLAAMGCEYAQGFHFSVPLTAREALNFIALHYDAAAKTDSSRTPGIGGQA